MDVDKPEVVIAVGPVIDCIWFGTTDCKDDFVEAGNCIVPKILASICSTSFEFLTFNALLLATIESLLISGLMQTRPAFSRL